MPGAVASGGHAGLVSTDPPAGSTVTLAPLFVRLDFGHDVLDLGLAVRVTGPDGRVVSAGAPRLYPSTVTQALAGPLPAGRYTVAWRVTGSGGRPLDGTFAFTAETAGDAGAAPAVLPADPGTQPATGTSSTTGYAIAPGALAAGGAVLALTLVLVVTAVRRRRSSSG